MKLAPETVVKMERSVQEPGRWAVLLADPPYNSWLNVPCTFASPEAAQRVADVILEEGLDS